MASEFRDSAELQRALAKTYLADERTSLVVWLAVELGRPILVEGPPGVGKTELAHALAATLASPLIRLQCYEGLDEAKALYEWNHSKQMLAAVLIRDQVQSTGSADKAVQSLYTREYLLPRPLLAAIECDKRAVVLLDEVDRADPEFEAFLLEFLAESQVTIPEFGTVKARHQPIVILTSNGTREMTDALRRRCLHLFLDYPPPSREQAILELRVPKLGADLARKITEYVASIRSLDLEKAPSISETIDWARALVRLNQSTLDPAIVVATLDVLVKHESDRELALRKLPPV